MQKLTFRIVTIDGGARIKVRDDGRRGPAVGDEAALWDALQEASAALQETLKEVQELTAELVTRPTKLPPTAASMPEPLLASPEVEALPGPPPKGKRR